MPAVKAWRRPLAESRPAEKAGATDSYQEFLTRLAKASGIETPTREDLARLDRRRKKKPSNKDWTNRTDPDAKVTKMKDGCTHLAHKAEHVVDLEAFVQNPKSGVIPDQDLQAIPTPIAKEKEMPRERIQIEALARQRGRAISRAPQIGRPGGHVDPDRKREFFGRTHS